ncbi:phytanoyl-CoA dioxygenase family protein [Candidatus Spongiihabitans sp.]|uniref:phytanoyl-CoA dioxygenase family protein n=1 Tax=Candidatus Spongiihabitans sp. TaxID=3101308 RepID=UPI003C79BA4B
MSMTMTLKSDYDKLGFLSPVDVLSQKQALRHRRCVQDAERRIGRLHYLAKVHTILRSPYQLATHPAVLDVVEQILGADILLYNTTYIIKEANTPAYVSWHQDLTYWGLDGAEQVSVWLALTVADEQSGCMRMIPGSHVNGQMEHDISHPDENNVLFQSQQVHGVNEPDAMHCPLMPGQASFHHGWTLHSSLPNHSHDRRIGLNIQYIAPHVRQTKLPGYSALLVRGTDRFHYYEEEIPATCDLDPAALIWHEQKNQLHFRIAGNA